MMSHLIAIITPLDPASHCIDRERARGRHSTGDTDGLPEERRQAARCGLPAGKALSGTAASHMSAAQTKPTAAYDAAELATNWCCSP